jgi:hypothetical protein
MTLPPPEPPPTLSYANDGRESAELRSITLLQRSLIITASLQICLWIAQFVIPSSALVLFNALFWGNAVVVMAFVGILGAKLNNLLVGIVLAALIVVPCAGLFIPVIVILQANDSLKKARRGRS